MAAKSWKNHLKKLHTYGSREVFFSAAPTAQNSPELHFRFINSFIQPSLLESLVQANGLRLTTKSFNKSRKYLFTCYYSWKYFIPAWLHCILLGLAWNSFQIVGCSTKQYYCQPLPFPGSKSFFRGKERKVKTNKRNAFATLFNLLKAGAV